MYLILSVLVISAAVYYSRRLFKRDLYRSEVPAILRYLGAWRVNAYQYGSASIDFSWGYWAPSQGLRFEISPSYEDNYLNIHLQFFWGSLSIIPKWRPKSWDANMCVNEAQNHRYGFGINSPFAYINWRDKRHAWALPVVETVFLGEQIVGQKQNLIFNDYDGTRVECTYWETVMTHRRKWTPIKIRTRRLNYDFNGAEVGPEKGSWKGGTMSGSCMIPKDATAAWQLNDVILRLKGSRR